MKQNRTWTKSNLTLYGTVYCGTGSYGTAYCGVADNGTTHHGTPYHSANLRGHRLLYYGRLSFQESMDVVPLGSAAITSLTSQPNPVAVTWDRMRPGGEIIVSSAMVNTAIVSSAVVRLP